MLRSTQKYVHTDAEALSVIVFCMSRSSYSTATHTSYVTGSRNNKYGRLPRFFSTPASGAGVATAAGHGPLMVGFDPIGDLVSELRRRFGHLAVFFSPGSAGTTGKIAVIWRPSAFVPRPYNVGQARHSMVFSGDKAMSEAGEGTGVPGVIVTVMNTMDVLAEMNALAGDMLDGVHLSSSS